MRLKNYYPRSPTIRSQNLFSISAELLGGMRLEPGLYHKESEPSLGAEVKSTVRAIKVFFNKAVSAMCSSPLRTESQAIVVPDGGGKPASQAGSGHLDQVWL